MSWCFNDSKHHTYLYDKRLPLEPGPHQWCFIASHKRLVVWWPGEGILCWHSKSRWLPFHRTNPTSVQSNFWHLVSRFHCQLVQSCLHYPMSDFSWSWNRHCSIWAPFLRRSCVWVIPSQVNKLKTHIYQASPTTTPCKLNLAARVVRGGAHFWGVLLPWQTRLHALTIASI